VELGAANAQLVPEEDDNDGDHNKSNNNQWLKCNRTKRDAIETECGLTVGYTVRMPAVNVFFCISKRQLLYTTVNFICLSIFGATQC